MFRYILICPFLFLVSANPVAAQIDYSEDVQPIFNSSCISCHGGTSGVTLSSYDATMNSVGVQYGMNIVIPDAPNVSPLVDKISSDNPEHGARMPQGGPFLSSDEIEAIRQWIEEGAHETVQTSGELITGVPEDYKLIGNYPNPFNPSTVIQFDAPVSSQYQLSIYSIIGKQVYQESGVVQAGRNDITVNLNSSPSGVYIYRIDFTNSGRQSSHTLGGRMTLVK